MAKNGVWESRRSATVAIRAGVTVVPIATAAGASLYANHVLPHAGSLLTAILRALTIVAISVGALRGIDKLARRLLPLATLMQLSLVFPDQAPSRLKLALKSGSGRRTNQLVADAQRKGLSNDPSHAAQQVVLLAAALNSHDRRTRGHSERVRLYADMIGEEMHLSTEERLKLQWAALLHDIGKIKVSPDILNKPAKLTSEESAEMRSHPDHGARFIAPLAPFLGEWVHGIDGHHEKWDGTGYPRGLRAEAIPRAAAIVAVADCFEVMTAVQSYKKAMSLREARAELTRCAGTHFSPEVVRVFLSISLGRIRSAMGPLAALAHVPFIGVVAQAPAAASAAVSSVAAPVANSMTAVAASSALAFSGAIDVAPVAYDKAPVVAEAVAPALASEAPNTTAGRALSFESSAGTGGTSGGENENPAASPSTTTTSGRKTTTTQASTTTLASTSTTTQPTTTTKPSNSGKKGA